MLYQKSETYRDNITNEVIEKKWFLKMGSVISVSDLLLEGESVDESYVWFTTRLDSESDIELGMEEVIKFLETME